MTQVGQIIRDICAEKGWSLRELARRADIPPATVHKIVVSEGMQPRPETLEAISNALGIGTRILLEAAAKDGGYLVTSVESESGLHMLMAGIKELPENRQQEIAALVEAMLSSQRIN
jgi:transcriptional regulator with XRE-family HTH domain